MREAKRQSLRKGYVGTGSRMGITLVSVEFGKGYGRDI